MENQLSRKVHVKVDKGHGYLALKRGMGGTLEGVLEEGEVVNASFVGPHPFRFALLKRSDDLLHLRLVHNNHLTKVDIWVVVR